jgi:hypothetical protein
MLRLGMFAFVAVLLSSVSATAGGAAKNIAMNNTKIFLEIQKLQDEIMRDHATRGTETAKASAEWDSKMKAVKFKDNKIDAAIAKVRDELRAAVDAINTGYAKYRMQFVNANGKLQTQRANLVQQRDTALAGLTFEGDAYNSTRADYNAKIAMIDALIVQNNAEWRQAHDKRIADVDAAHATFDPQIQKLAASDTASDNQLANLMAGKAKALTVINARHDSFVNTRAARITKLQQQIK